jgi:hypothetical protein
VIALVIAGGCGDKPTPTGDEGPGVLAVLANELLGPAHEDGPAERVLVDYRRAVEDAALIEGATEREQVREIARRIARTKLATEIETIHAHAHWFLGRLPRADRIDLDGWSVTGRAFTAADLPAASAFAKTPVDEGERLERLVDGWNPYSLAYALDNELATDAEARHARWALEGWAPPDVVLVGDDLDAPTIVLDGAHELAIMRMKWDKGGFFVPLSYERYARAQLAAADPAVRAPKGDLAAGQGPGYTHIVEFHRAVQLAAASEKLGEDANQRIKEIAFRIAGERLLPHVDVLHERSHWLMRRWLGAPSGEWTDAQSSTSTTDLASMVDEMIGAHPMDQDRAARVLAGWHVVHLAGSLRWQIEERARKDSGRAPVVWLHRYSRAELVLVEDDLDAPTIGLEGARERLLLRFRWDPQGYYVPTGAQLQRRVGAY